WSTKSCMVMRESRTIRPMRSSTSIRTGSRKCRCRATSKALITELACASTIALEARPSLLQRNAQDAAEEDGPAVLIGHRKRHAEGCGDGERLTGAAPRFLAAVDMNDHAAVMAARSPQPILILSADCGRQVIGGTEEVDRGGLAVVRSDDCNTRLLFGAE